MPLINYDTSTMMRTFLEYLCLIRKLARRSFWAPKDPVPWIGPLDGIDGIDLTAKKFMVITSHCQITCCDITRVDRAEQWLVGLIDWLVGWVSDWCKEHTYRLSYLVSDKTYQSVRTHSIVHRQGPRLSRPAPGLSSHECSCWTINDDYFSCNFVEFCRREK